MTSIKLRFPVRCRCTKQKYTHRVYRRLSNASQLIQRAASKGIRCMFNNNVCPIPPTNRASQYCIICDHERPPHVTDSHFIQINKDPNSQHIPTHFSKTKKNQQTRTRTFLTVHSLQLCLSLSISLTPITAEMTTNGM